MLWKPICRSNTEQVFAGVSFLFELFLVKWECCQFLLFWTKIQNFDATPFHQFSLDFRTFYILLLPNTMPPNLANYICNQNSIHEMPIEKVKLRLTNWPKIYFVYRQKWMWATSMSFAYFQCGHVSPCLLTIWRRVTWLVWVTFQNCESSCFTNELFLFRRKKLCRQITFDRRRTSMYKQRICDQDQQNLLPYHIHVVPMRIAKVHFSPQLLPNFSPLLPTSPHALFASFARTTGRIGPKLWG